MTKGAAAPPYKTGVIWAVLSVLLLIGTAAAAFVVWGLTDAFSTHRYLLDAVAMIVGGSVAVYVGLMIAGVLYRIDRLRGVPHRRIELFE
ncbi:MAG TPA: hypothetical protein VGV89_06240 [Thermoplasmata archaeon]|nr:hypothetical protein [Thermoplasmata archaeon]